LEQEILGIGIWLLVKWSKRGERMDIWIVIVLKKKKKGVNVRVPVDSGIKVKI